jgi:hypothetical protein
MARISSKMQVLYKSEDLCAFIKRTIGSPLERERRVVLVAYVGKSAEAFLPDPQGLEIICALEPGATSAETLIRLRERGARIRQSDRLHMKVYWSSHKGAVVCSANVSANALGKCGLREAGVWLPKGAVNIETLLRQAQPRPIRDADLRILARKSDRFDVARPRLKTAVDDESPELRTWLSSRARKPLKLGWWNDTGVIAKSAKAEALARYGVKEPSNFICGAKGYFSPGDWVLQFNVDGGRSASWMYVDFVTKVPSTDKRAFSRSYPYQAVQIHPSRLIPASPPFRLNSESREAIARSVSEFGEPRFSASKTARLPLALESLLGQHLAIS